MENQLLQAAKNNRLVQVKELLDAGADINLADYDTGNTALHLACANGAKQTLEYLVERGANVNAQNVQLRTPLHVLVAKRFDQMAFYLVKHGAKLDIEDRRGETPRDLALPFLQKDLDLAAAGNVTKLEQQVQEQQKKKEEEELRNKQFKSPAREEVLKVYLDNSSYKSVMIKNQMNVSDLAVIMAQKLNMDASYGNYLDIFEIQKDSIRKLNNTESILEARMKWPTILGKSGNETLLHCRLICKPKRFAPEDVIQRYNHAMK